MKYNEKALKASKRILKQALNKAIKYGLGCEIVIELQDDIKRIEMLLKFIKCLKDFHLSKIEQLTLF